MRQLTLDMPTDQPRRELAARDVLRALSEAWDDGATTAEQVGRCGSNDGEFLRAKDHHMLDALVALGFSLDIEP